MQLFTSAKLAPLTRSQELPRRLTQDIRAPTITLSSSAPSKISTFTRCGGLEVPVFAPLSDDTCGPVSTSPDPFSVTPQEDAISISESFVVERLEAPSSSPTGPASSHSQNSIVSQPTANAPQIPVSTLFLFSSPTPTPSPGFGPPEDILVTESANEACKDGEPLSIQPMGILHETVALAGDIEGIFAFPSAAEGSPGHTVVASAIGSVAPSIEVTFPMDQHESVRTSLESPSTPCTRTKATAFVETQDPPSSLSLEPAPCNSSKPLSPVHATSTGQNRPKHKLASPFRSPLKPKRIRHENLPPSSPMEDPTIAKLDSTDKQSRGRFLLPPIPPKKPEFTLGSHIKNTSTHAAKSAFKPLTFKSPLRTSPATPTTPQSSIIYPSSGPKKTASIPIWTPSENRSATALTIQTLERRLALLKRAIKIKSEHEGEERLENLTRKWKDVARDVGWELWAIVKQNHEGGIVNVGDERGLFTHPRDENGFGGRFRSGWGWDNKDKGEASTNWNAEPGDEEHPREEDVEKEEEPENRLTMSVMLRQLGVAESTLGWDEAEGDFKAD